ncbi:MAG: PrsW family intramembrane metalloprotease [Clostridia bacterium]|nr:PrsW family intramembrane metalloprotease [Clostridia bacterium]
MRCEKCGFDFDASLGRCPKCNASVEFSGNTQFYQLARKSHVKFKEIFSGTFRKHPVGTAAKIFAAGTPETTPAPDKMLTAWQKPWLYSRFLIAGILFLAVGYFLALFLNPGLLAVLGSFGAMITPFAVLIFVWEMNIPRDISFIKVIAFFVVGGVASMLLTFLFGLVFREGYEAPIAAFVEEPAKLLIILLFFHRNKTKYGFGGMLIGTAVGAGFAVFETVAYVFNSFMEGGVEDGQSTFILRSILAIGCHVTWGAIAGAGVALGRKGKTSGTGYLTSPIFYGCVVANIFLHFAWNGGLGFDGVLWLLTVFVDSILALVLLFILINLCLKQVVKAYDDARTQVLNMAPAAFAGEPVQTPAAPSFENYTAPAFPSFESYTAPAAPSFGGYTAPAVPVNVPAEDHTMPMTPVQNAPAAKPVTVRTAVIRSAYLRLERPIDKVLTIGRDSAGDIVFPADTAGVSRKHCAVMASENGMVYVMDLGSSVGTFSLDGRRLPANEWTPVDRGFYVAAQTYAFTVQAASYSR